MNSLRHTRRVAGAGPRTLLAAVASASCLSLLLFAAAARAADDPFPVRDQNPLVRGVYLPLPSHVPDVPGWQLATTVQWSNTANIDSTARDQLVVDAETVELDLTLARAVGPWRFRATVPVSWRGAGVLDSFIESFHDFLGLPQGNRPELPKDSYDVRYQRNGQPVTSVREGTSLGDIQLEAGRVLATGADRELVAWLGADLPTGSETHGTGNGGVDVAAWLAGRIALGDKVEMSGQAGAVVPNGDGPVPSADVAGFGTVALGWRIVPSFTALAQVDIHSSLASGADAEFLQTATILTLGGRIRMKSGTVFEAGVSEDIAVNHSPDVVIYIGFRWAPFR